MSWTASSSGSSSLLFVAALFLVLLLEPSSAEVSCHYCGVADNCPQPYIFDPDGEEEPAMITCPQSCMKFDGFAQDGYRVSVR